MPETRICLMLPNSRNTVNSLSSTRRPDGREVPWSWADTRGDYNSLVETGAHLWFLILSNT